jgi:hypothetical protein
MTKANKEFIVRACNAHENLIKALELYHSGEWQPFECTSKKDKEYSAFVKATLAKARGEV